MKKLPVVIAASVLLVFVFMTVGSANSVAAENWENVGGQNLTWLKTYIDNLGIRLAENIASIRSQLSGMTENIATVRSQLTTMTGQIANIISRLDSAGVDNLRNQLTGINSQIADVLDQLDDTSDIDNLRNWMTGQLTSISDQFSSVVEDLQDYVENLVSTSVLGKEFTVYAMTESGVQTVSPMSTTLPFLDNQLFSPLYAPPNSMVILYVVDKETQTPVDGFLSLGMSWFGGGESEMDMMDMWMLMMMLQQQGGMSGTVFTYSINDGVVWIPAMGSSWMATITAPDYKNFQFLIKIGEEALPEIVQLTSVGTLTVGESATIRATKGGNPISGTLVIEDPDSSNPDTRYVERTGSSISFTPGSSTFDVKLLVSGAEVVRSSFYAIPPAGTDYSVPIAIVVILVILAVVYRCRQRVKGIMGRIFKIGSGEGSYPR